VLERDRRDEVGPAATIPLAWGPPIDLPPEKTTTSAPSATNRRRFDRGGSSAAASTITGTPRAWAISQTSGRGTVPGVSRIGQATAAVRSVIAASICQPKVPPAPGWPRYPTSTIRTPTARIAWS
jgi:hypothetical protein